MASITDNTPRSQSHSNILRKLGVANRTEAATAAQRHGLIADR
jgi:DNA-binding NarL/FixJ family response regulator